MAKSGELLEIPELGIQVRFVRTAADTGGEACEFEVSGRPRGFLTQAHIHATQTERLEPVSGSMKVVMDGRSYALNPGDGQTVPPGTAHTQVPMGTGAGTVRITHTPAGDTEGFLEKVAGFSRDGRILKGGWPRPTAAAELIRDFGQSGSAARPPAAVQRALATGILATARAARAVRERAAGASDNEYLFVDEWDVAAPPQAVFDALADARTYPRWWTPVYLDVEADGPPKLGKVSAQHFKGRLPYHLHTRSTITRLEPPHVVEGDVEGDLRGRGTWTLTPIPGGTHVRFDWRVLADRTLLRTLTPVLRPVFRWNHNWAIARAMDGLEPYARGAAAAASAPATPVPSAG
ncbi:MAG: hypothetical protein QOH72_3005 [Solirubrobacteraceae bacterium]|jgi:uncharacterized protein YndB with AHSA1/START domain/mannose-6-phosphate isomerase-like protein (cupin superfamily)|nr:hypothetical protein [Solirubrobacteraceae bacterium]